MKRRHARPPKARSLMIVVEALQAQIPSTPPVCTMQQSYNGTPNLRYEATTKDVPWTVDIYLGHYYRVQIGNQLGEVFRTLPALLGYLFRTLGVTPAPQPTTPENHVETNH